MAASAAAQAHLARSVLQLRTDSFSCGGNHAAAHLTSYLAGEGHGSGRTDDGHTIDASTTCTSIAASITRCLCLT